MVLDLNLTNHKVRDAVRVCLDMILAIGRDINPNLDFDTWG